MTSPSQIVQMTMSPAGAAVLKYFERLALKAYPDPFSPLRVAQRCGQPCDGLSGAPWAIGYGDTGPDVTPDLVITEAQAEARLARRLVIEFGPMLGHALLVPTTQGQFDALSDMLYNVGAGRQDTPGRVGRSGLILLRTGGPSTVLRLHNAGDTAGAAQALLDWDRAGGVSVLGLRRRCAARRALYEGKDGQQAIQIGANTR